MYDSRLQDEGAYHPQLDCQMGMWRLNILKTKDLELIDKNIANYSPHVEKPF